MKVITRDTSAHEFAVFYEVDADTLYEILADPLYYKDQDLVKRASSQKGDHAVVLLLAVDNDVNILRDRLDFLLSVYKSVSWYDRGHNRFYTQHAKKGEKCATE